MKAILALCAVAAAVAVVVLAHPAAARGRCLFVVPIQGNEALVNRCGQCMMGQVIRARTTGGMQGQRTFAVPAKTSVDLTFNYPGKTRVLSERACGPDPATTPYKDASGNRASNLSCVKMTQTNTGKSAMVNSCTVCRAVELEVLTRKDGTKIETETIRANTIALLKSYPDARAVRIRGEKACPLR